MTENQTKINILVVSLNDKFCKNVATRLADKLDMFVADCQQMIIYELTNPKQVLEKCGFEYLLKRERSVMKHCSEFYNTVMSIDFELFKEFYEHFDKSIIVYLRLPEEKTSKVANKIDYEVRDNLLMQKSHIVVELDKCLVIQSIKNIIAELGEFYENC